MSLPVLKAAESAGLQALLMPEDSNPRHADYMIPLRMCSTEPFARAGGQERGRKRVGTRPQAHSVPAGASHTLSNSRSVFSASTS
jgi:hypothetical protein